MKQQTQTKKLYTHHRKAGVVERVYIPSPGDIITGNGTDYYNSKPK
jgi:hypothetical protein